MALIKVHYLGTSDIREISADDPGLKVRGIKVDKTMRWSAHNGWAIVIDGLSDAMEQLFRDEGTFTLTELDAETGKAVQAVVTSSRSDDTGDTVVDGTTGQKSKKS